MLQGVLLAPILTLFHVLTKYLFLFFGSASKGLASGVTGCNRMFSYHNSVGACSQHVCLSCCCVIHIVTFTQTLLAPLEPTLVFCSVTTSFVYCSFKNAH